MYRAKADGRGRFCFFEPDMDARAQARRLLELDLRSALVHGGFELHYQPLFNLKTNAVTGFEALMRWSTPERGRVSPGDFIPLAEDTGLIVPIGEWALRQACAEAATWPDDIRVAVNLSPNQFKSGGVVAAVVSALSHSGLPANRLELEITESVVLAKTDDNLRSSSSSARLGVRIAMDDFGTGYSSLSYLRSFRFDKVKIDQSFIRDLSEGDDSRAIVRAVVGARGQLRHDDDRRGRRDRAADAVPARRGLGRDPRLSDQPAGSGIGHPGVACAHQKRSVRTELSGIGEVRLRDH